MMGSKSVFSANPLRMAGLVAALAAAALILPLGPALRLPLFDVWQRFSPRDLSDTPVRVVLIDSESVQEVGAWPWPRFYLAELTRRIAGQGASVIAYDVLFAEVDRLGPKSITHLYPQLSSAAKAELQAQTAPDDLFALIIGEAPVVLARVGTRELQGTGALDGDDTLPKALPSSVLTFPRVVQPVPELGLVAAGQGIVNAEPDADGLFRQVPLLARIGSAPTAGLALESARIALGAQAIGFRHDRVQLGDRTIPVTPRGAMRLRLGRFPPDRQISAVDLLRSGGRFDLKGKPVLIGLAAEGTVDVVATPIDDRIYGVLVQAQALDALLRGSGWLERPRWAAAFEWGAAAVLAALALWLLPRRGHRQWIVPLLGTALFAGTWLAFTRLALLLDPLPALTVTGASALAIGLASLQRTRRERERLRGALVEERVASAGTEAELEAARAIQQAMLPRPETLGRLDNRVQVTALLEPARSVGGDFYDVIALEGGRLAFAIGDVAGRGVPAALFMALSKALAKGALLREPLETLAPAIQTELSRDAPEEMGLTMIIGVLDLASGEVRLINAGHENPVRVLANGTAEEVTLEGGPPFCITDYPWPVEAMSLDAGDTLVLFTDGVSEAQDGDGRLFGRSRVVEALASADAEGVVAALVDAVRAFEGGSAASDDLTVLAITYAAK